MLVDQKNEYCTVIVIVTGDPDAIESVLAHAADGLGLFAGFPGFIGGATHLSEDRTRIVQYLQWKDRDSHENCMNDLRWDAQESSRDFKALVESGRLQVDVQCYDVVRSRD